MSAWGVNLAWDPSPDTNVIGYAIHYGTNTGSYQARIDVGNQTNGTIQLPADGVTYFFVVTAHTADGVESLPSNEVNYTTPGSLHVATSSESDLGLVSFQAQAGETLTVQASEDLVKWKTLYQLKPNVTQTCQIVDPDATLLPKRFYRLGGNNVAARKIKFARLPSAPRPKVSFVGGAGQLVQVQATDNQGNWATLYQLQLVTNQTVSLVDPTSTLDPLRSYRLVFDGSPSSTVTYLGPGAVRCTPMPGRLAVLGFQGQAGEAVSVQTSDDLKSWTTLYELHPSANQLVQVADPTSGFAPQRFYRLMGTNSASRKLQLSWLPAATAPKLSFVGPSGDLVQIQASDDRVNWTTLNQLKITTDQWVDFVDPTPMSVPMRFYRLVFQSAPASQLTYLGPGALRCSRTPGHLAMLGFQVQAGETVSVQSSEELGNWETLYELHPSTSQMMRIVDPSSDFAPQRFYRLVGANVASRQLQFSWLPTGTVSKLSFVAPPGDVVQVQGSEDLKDWTTLNQIKITTNQWVDFVDPASASLPLRFYRLAPGN